MRALIIIFITSLISGCGLFYTPDQNPVTEVKINQNLFKDAKVGALALTPERRNILVRFEQPDWKGDTSTMLCAESPTEIGLSAEQISNIATTIKTANTAEGALSAALSALRSNSTLNQRGQALQYLQSSSFVVCQMYINGYLNPSEALEMQQRVILAAGELLAYEIPYMYQHKAEANNTEPTDKANDKNGKVTPPATPAAPTKPDLSQILDITDLKQAMQSREDKQIKALTPRK